MTEGKTSYYDMGDAQYKIIKDSINPDYPFSYLISCAHPDGPEGYRHPYWNDQELIHIEELETQEECEAAVKRWTPERRRKYLSQEPSYWSGYYDVIHRRGWFTAKGRRKYWRVDEKDGYPFSALALTNDDFRHGITMDILYDLHIYTSESYNYEQDLKRGREREDKEEMEARRLRLQDPSTYVGIRSAYERAYRLAIE